MLGRTSSLRIDCGNAINNEDITTILYVETGKGTIAKYGKNNYTIIIVHAAQFQFVITGSASLHTVLMWYWVDYEKMASAVHSIKILIFGRTVHIYA